MHDIKVVVVDDEAIARRKVVDFLRKEKSIEVSGVCSNAAEALGVIRESKPDLVFLDIQMSTSDGFTVLEELRAAQVHPFPVIVFTTAHDQYAIKAFENCAFDYLLKPFSRKRFQQSVEREREHIRTSRSSALGMQVASYLKTISSDTGRLVFRANGRFIFLHMREIRWISAEGNYVRVYAGTASHLVRETLSKVEEKLDPEKFLRIHRSTIVNLRFVKELRASYSEGESAVLLNDGTRLTLSRGYRSRIDKLVGAESLG